MSEVYQKKNILIGKSTKRVSQIPDKNNAIIKDEGARLKGWAEYFEGILNADERTENIDFASSNISEELDTIMETPTRGKLDRAIALLKRNKVPGIDNITSEILKDGCDTIREWLLCIAK